MRPDTLADSSLDNGFDDRRVVVLDIDAQRLGDQDLHYGRNRDAAGPRQLCDLGRKLGGDVGGQLFTGPPAAHTSPVGINCARWMSQARSSFPSCARAECRALILLTRRAR